MNSPASWESARRETSLAAARSRTGKCSAGVRAESPPGSTVAGHGQWHKLRQGKFSLIGFDEQANTWPDCTWRLTGEPMRCTTGQWSSPISHLPSTERRDSAQASHSGPDWGTTQQSQCIAICILGADIQAGDSSNGASCLCLRFWLTVWVVREGVRVPDCARRGHSSLVTA